MREFRKNTILMGMVVIVSMACSDISYANGSLEIKNDSPVLINTDNAGVESTNSNVGNDMAENNSNQIQTSVNNNASGMNTVVNNSNNNNNYVNNNASGMNTVVNNSNNNNNYVDNNANANINNNVNGTTNNTTNGNVNNNLNNSIIGNNQVTLSGGSLGKAEDYVERKLFDVIGFFQAIVRPLVYLTFIISVISVLFGVVTSSKSKFYGFIGMAVSVFAYVAVILAPQIVDYFSAWLSM